MIIITMYDMMIVEISPCYNFGLKDKVLPFGYHPSLNKQNNDKV